MDTKKLVLCAMFAALTCVLAPIAIPMPGGVPVTLATFSVMLAGCLLGPGAGTLSQLIYLLIGMAGVPVFSGMRGGIGVLAGMTGGYLVGYLLLAAVSGAIYRLYCRKVKGGSVWLRRVVLMLAMICGTVCLYVFGTAWFMIVTGNTLAVSLTACVLPFLPGDLIKMILVAFLVPVLSKRIQI